MSQTGKTAQAWEDDIPVKVRAKLGGATLRKGATNIVICGAGCFPYEFRETYLARHFGFENPSTELRDAVLYLEMAIEDEPRRRALKEGPFQKPKLTWMGLRPSWLHDD